MGVKMNQRRPLCVICTLKGEYFQWHEIWCICQKSAVSHDKLRHPVHSPVNGFCLGVKVYFVFSWNTTRGFSRLKDTLWTPTCEVSLNLRTTREAGNCWSPALWLHFPKCLLGKQASTLTVSPTSAGGLVALIGKNSVVGDLEPLECPSGAVTADELTPQGGLATSTCLLSAITNMHTHTIFLIGSWQEGRLVLITWLIITAAADIKWPTWRIACSSATSTYVSRKKDKITKCKDSKKQYAESLTLDQKSAACREGAQVI